MEEVRSYLLHLSTNEHKGLKDVPLLPSTKREQLEEVQEIQDMLSIIKTKYSSFFDYSLIQSLLEAFKLDDSQEKLGYPLHLQEYADARSIQELIFSHALFARISDQSQMKLVVTVDKALESKLSYLKNLHKIVAKVLGIDNYAVRLFDVEMDSDLVMTFQIVSHLGKAIFAGEKHGIFSAKKMQEFREANIQQLKCNGYEWDFRGAIPGLYISDK